MQNNHYHVGGPVEGEMGVYFKGTEATPVHRSWPDQIGAGDLSNKTCNAKTKNPTQRVGERKEFSSKNNGKQVKNLSGLIKFLK